MKNTANENVMADLINDGSPFGVIFIADNDKLIEKLRLIERRSKKIKYDIQFEKLFIGIIFIVGNKVRV
ncbi:hypothetical protein VN0004_07830 [Helicobacter pylori]